MRRLIQHIISLWRDHRGALMVELGVTMPVMMIAMLGGTEAVRMALLVQKLDRVATTVGDLVSQEETLTEAEVTAIFDAVTPILNPFPWGGKGRVDVSSITAPGTLNWTRSFGSFSSAGTATLSGSGVTWTAGQTVIYVEAKYDYTPLFPYSAYTAVFDRQTLTRHAYYRPRIGDLTAVSAN